MSNRFLATTLVGAALLCGAASARTETLRCQSVNGNLNCAGSSGTSCQTIDGRTTCVSGGGGIVQSFGNPPPDITDDTDDDDDMPAPPYRH